MTQVSEAANYDKQVTAQALKGLSLTLGIPNPKPGLMSKSGLRHCESLQKNGQ